MPPLQTGGQAAGTGGTWAAQGKQSCGRGCWHHASRLGLQKAGGSTAATSVNGKREIRNRVAGKEEGAGGLKSREAVASSSCRQQDLVLGGLQLSTKSAGLFLFACLPRFLRCVLHAISKFRNNLGGCYAEIDGRQFSGFNLVTGWKLKQNFSQFCVQQFSARKCNVNACCVLNN